MDMEIREVAGRKDLKTFIYLPEEIHKGHRTWIHPIYMDEWTYFNPKKNVAFSYCDTILLLAFRNGRAVGRIMGIINTRYNEHKNEKTARFGYLETWEEREVAVALLERIEEWARDKGMTRVVGPYGFSDQDPEGFLVEGFDIRATIATYHNFDWMPGMVESAGYSKDIDYVVYKIDISQGLPEFYEKIFTRINRRKTFEIINFKKKKEMKPWIKPILGLMNECYMDSNIYGYSPLSEKEMEDLARRYWTILDQRFIKVVLKDGEIVAFIIAIPDMTEGIQRARGHILPFGIFKILRAAKKTKQLDLLLGAVKEPYRGMGIDVLMGFATIASAHEANMLMIDTHHEMETNLKVRAEMERAGGEIYKKYRVFQKDL
jgi:GNAT superfamily N-acetyltransferase